MKLAQKMIAARDELLKLGHEVILPRHTEEYAQMNTPDHIHNESVKNKINHDLIRDYYQKIGASDAVLVLNYDLNGVKNYIGGNSFLEAAFAHVLNKKLYFLFAIPEMGYSDELIAFQPIILEGDFSKII